MFGHDWQKAEATIVLVHVEATGSGRFKRRDFVADIHPPSGPVFRATIPDPRVMVDFLSPNQGDRVGVLIRDDKVKFDLDDVRLSRKARSQDSQAQFAAAVGGAPGTGSGAAPTRVAGEMDIDAIRAAAMEAMASGAATFVDGRTMRPGDQDDAAARLAKLDSLKQRGLMTDAEYAAARQRIIDAI